MPTTVQLTIIVKINAAEYPATPAGAGFPDVVECGDQCGKVAFPASWWLRGVLDGWSHCRSHRGDSTCHYWLDCW